jgi:hypothetical protein
MLRAYILVNLALIVEEHTIDVFTLFSIAHRGCLRLLLVNVVPKVPSWHFCSNGFPPIKKENLPLLIKKEAYGF